MSRVTIRHRSISKARKSIYLDYSPPIYNPHKGKFQRKEYLKLFLFDKPISKPDRLHNKETKSLIEFIRASRQIDIQNKRFGFLSETVRDSSFIDFFRNYVSKRQKSSSDNNAMSLRYFMAFADKSIRFSDLNDFLCEDYKNFLLGGPGISRRGKPIGRNTAVNYFAKFRSALRKAFSNGFIDLDLYGIVPPIKVKETHRHRLDIEELQKLADTASTSDLMKRAALFSGLTGLRFSDVQTLKFSEVKGRQGNYYLQYTQSKTDAAEILPISDQAVALMKNKGKQEQLVFKGLKYSKLKPFFVSWLSSAEIKKNITFHSFRHTYATLQLAHGTDVFTLSKMLGHKSLRSTQVYAKIVDAKKIEAATRIFIDIKKI